MPRVFLLKPGSIQRDKSGKVLDARSSVTLIISGKRKIVVDTGLEGEAEQIERALAGLGLLPEEIDGIVNTHSHPDHCGNNHLFSRAERLAPQDGQLICPGVWTLATPGHSLDSISVVVGPMPQALKKADMAPGIPIIVIAGDALPTFGNFQKDVPPALHVDRDLAVSSMNKIIALADTVVPGHDYPFSVRKSRYLELPVPKPSARRSAAQALTD
jgi:glyoxylase-like metal-dependent hydrolase (beta-lactamase superfamily II)